jgi:superfamily II DNA or RNA helicase
MQPYQYQSQLINDAIRATLKHDTILIQAATGAGKTVMFSFIAHRFIAKSTTDVIIYVDSEDLVNQTRTTIFNCFGISAQPILAGMRHVPKNRIYIAMINSVGKRMPSNIGLGIVDECFLAGTKVSEKNIEEIVPGDFVDSFNHNTGFIEKRKVISTSKKETTNDLLLIKFQYEQFICTQEHPIFVEGKGYIPAKDLQIKDITYGINKLHTLQHRTKKRKFYSKRMEVEIKKFKVKGKNFLYSILQSRVLCKNAFRENDFEKSNDESGYFVKNEGHIKKDRTQANNSRRQWKGNDSSAKNVIRGTWRRMVSGISCSNRKWIPTASLQNRFRLSGKENSNRSRWWQSLFFNGSEKRQKETRFPSKQRVQSIEIYKQGYIGGRETNCKNNSNFVYNLEVEGNNNYFANGILVHNCHIATLHKAHAFTQGVKIIGFTATPISADKKLPLKDIYKKIVVGPQISTLIQEGKLCQNLTIAPKDVVDRNELAVKGGDFDTTKMGGEFSKAKHVKNTLKYYEKFIKGKKTLIFNCNVAHSVEVCKHFVAAGYNCKHVDAENVSKFEYKQILLWLKNTPDAILCSVGKMTKGFDEPSIEAIIVNRSIMSLSLWLQITGRGGRIFPNKAIFFILDMGGNAVNLGDWSDDRDWESIFYNPPAPRKNAGVAPCKSCPKCDAIIAAQARECKWCEFVFPIKPVEDEQEISEEYRVLTKGIDIDKFIARSEKLGHKPFASFYKIGERIMKNSANKDKAQLIKVYESEAKKWCAAMGKTYNAFHKKLITEFIEEEIAKLQAPQNSLTPLKPITNLYPSWL